MSSEIQHTQNPLMEEFLKRPQTFGFFQLVHLLERLTASSEDKDAEKEFLRQAVRYRTDPGMGFPASDVTALEKLEGHGDLEERYRMTVSFLGLYGSGAPSPGYFSEMICQSDDDPDNFRDFLDLFNHRLIDLYYRAWKKLRPYMQLDHEWFASRVSGFLGLSLSQLQQQLPGFGGRLLEYAGLFSQQPHSAQNLARLVSGLFDGIDVQVQELVPDWTSIPAEDRNRLGTGNTTLGDDLSLGGRIFDPAGKFRVVLGPLDYELFESFLPGGSRHKSLCKIVDLFAPESLTADFVAILKKSDVPPLQLAGGETRRLGLDSWLCTRQATTDMQVRFDPGTVSDQAGKTP